MTNTEIIEQKQLLEQKCFEVYALTRNVNKYSFTSLKSPYDVKMQSGASYFISEIKVRHNQNMSFLEQNGAMLELTKIEGMNKERIRIKKESGVDVRMLYFNFCSDGLLIYELNQPHFYKFDWWELPVNNHSDDLKHKLITKIKQPIELQRYESKR